VETFDASGMNEWHPIETVPDGQHVLLWFPRGECGIGGMECATVYRHDEQSSTGFSFWTHGGPNAGDDWEPRNSEAPTHWMPLPEPPNEPGGRQKTPAELLTASGDDPTPWCLYCGPKSACTCGPIAENE